MRKSWKWLKNNKLATFVIFCVAWAVHYTFETLIVNNVLKLVGFAMPAMVLV